MPPVEAKRKPGDSTRLFSKSTFTNNTSTIEENDNLLNWIDSLKLRVDSTLDKQKSEMSRLREISKQEATREEQRKRISLASFDKLGQLLSEHEFAASLPSQYKMSSPERRDSPYPEVAATNDYESFSPKVPENDDAQVSDDDVIEILSDESGANSPQTEAEEEESVEYELEDMAHAERAEELKDGFGLVEDEEEEEEEEDDDEEDDDDEEEEEKEEGEESEEIEEEFEPDSPTHAYYGLKRPPPGTVFTLSKNRPRLTDVLSAKIHDDEILLSEASGDASASDSGVYEQNERNEIEIGSDSEADDEILLDKDIVGSDSELGEDEEVHLEIEQDGSDDDDLERNEEDEADEMVLDNEENNASAASNFDQIAAAAEENIDFQQALLALQNAAQSLISSHGLQDEDIDNIEPELAELESQFDKEVEGIEEQISEMLANQTETPPSLELEALEAGISISEASVQLDSPSEGSVLQQGADEFQEVMIDKASNIMEQQDALSDTVTEDVGLADDSFFSVDEEGFFDALKSESPQDDIMEISDSASGSDVEENAPLEGDNFLAALAQDVLKSGESAIPEEETTHAVEVESISIISDESSTEADFEPESNEAKSTATTDIADIRPPEADSAIAQPPPRAVPIFKTVIEKDPRETLDQLRAFQRKFKIRLDSVKQLKEELGVSDSESDALADLLEEFVVADALEPDLVKKPQRPVLQQIESEFSDLDHYSDVEPDIRTSTSTYTPEAADLSDEGEVAIIEETVMPAEEALSEDSEDYHYSETQTELRNGDNDDVTMSLGIGELDSPESANLPLSSGPSSPTLAPTVLEMPDDVDQPLILYDEFTEFAEEVFLRPSSIEEPRATKSTVITHIDVSPVDTDFVNDVVSVLPSTIVEPEDADDEFVVETMEEAEDIVLPTLIEELESMRNTPIARTVTTTLELEEITHSFVAEEARPHSAGYPKPLFDFARNQALRRNTGGEEPRETSSDSEETSEAERNLSSDLMAGPLEFFDEEKPEAPQVSEVNAQLLTEDRERKRAFDEEDLTPRKKSKPWHLFGWNLPWHSNQKAETKDLSPEMAAVEEEASNNTLIEIEASLELLQDSTKVKEASDSVEALNLLEIAPETILSPLTNFEVLSKGADVSSEIEQRTEEDTCVVNEQGRDVFVDKHLHRMKMREAEYIEDETSELTDIGDDEPSAALTDFDKSFDADVLLHAGLGIMKADETSKKEECDVAGSPADSRDPTEGKTKPGDSIITKLAAPALEIMHDVEKAVDLPVDDENSSKDKVEQATNPDKEEDASNLIEESHDGTLSAEIAADNEVKNNISEDAVLPRTPIGKQEAHVPSPKSPDMARLIELIHKKAETKLSELTDLRAPDTKRQSSPFAEATTDVREAKVPAANFASIDFQNAAGDFEEAIKQDTKFQEDDKYLLRKLRRGRGHKKHEEEEGYIDILHPGLLNNELEDVKEKHDASFSGSEKQLSDATGVKSELQMESKEPEVNPPETPKDALKRKVAPEVRQSARITKRNEEGHEAQFHPKGGSVPLRIKSTPLGKSPRKARATRSARKKKEEAPQLKSSPVMSSFQPTGYAGSEEEPPNPRAEDHPALRTRSRSPIKRSIQELSSEIDEEPIKKRRQSRRLLNKSTPVAKDAEEEETRGRSRDR